MIDQIDALIADFASFVWGLPLLILLSGGGLYLLIRSGFVQFRYLGHAIQVLRGKYDDPNAPGEISHFQALTTALSSTIGMGNVAGVAVAITIGGPGAVFWLWISGIIGMSTKFFTSALAVMYRGKEPGIGGETAPMQGGPMYFIVEGLGKHWRPLAVFFCAAGMIGVLPVFNVNQLTQAIRDVLLEPQGLATDQANWFIGIGLAILTSVIIFGGLDRISKTAAAIVPSMVVLYMVSVFIILGVHISELPHYLGLIFTDAFAATHYKGDPLLGGVIGGLILHGMRRGAFSNEAGIGTAPMAHGAAKTAEPIREGLVAMLGPAIDTLLICTLTALAILVTGVWETTGDNGVTLTSNAFEAAMPGYGKYLLLICVASFSISSLFSYSYYGTKCLAFIVGRQHKRIFNYFYIASIVMGAVFPLSAMLNLIDGSFALMAIPTMLATLIMAPRVLKEAKRYFSKL